MHTADLSTALDRPRTIIPHFYSTTASRKPQHFSQEMSNTCPPSSLWILLYFAVENGHLAGQTGSKLEKAAMFLAHGIQHDDQAQITDALSH
ncbi:MAG TPA: hypothetical protein VIY29_17635 [Ktedonobacteraceae bacterium]